jgi:hypothetical protein
MDENQFAAISKAMGKETTRRGAIARLFGGLAAAIAGTALAAQELDAKGKSKKGKAKKKSRKSGNGSGVAKEAVAGCTPTGNSPDQSNIPQAQDSICGDPVVQLSNQVPDVCGCLGFDFGFKYDTNESGGGTFTCVKYDSGGDLIQCTAAKCDEDPDAEDCCAQCTANGDLTPVNFAYDTTSHYLNWWTSGGCAKVGAVVMKASTDNNLYTYNAGQTSDTCLYSPLNSQGAPRDLSHVIFCYDYKLKVSKTADTEYTRTWHWDVAKTCPPDQEWSRNQTDTLTYQVTPSVGTPVDSGFKVTGQITIENCAPIDATIADISDQISGGIDAIVDCPDSFDGALPAGKTLTCDYSAEPGSKTNGTNTVTVTTSGAVGGGTATADYTFGQPTTKVDECVTLTDAQCTLADDKVCQNDTLGPIDCTQTYAASELDCGANTISNTATVETSLDQDPSATCNFTITVDCAGGCTLTQGYWKTHSRYGPAKKRDATWDKAGPQGEDTIFFLSGKTWYGVLWTPPAGNAYYNLAHQYIAAKLNILAGASSTPAVDAAIAGAEGWFSTKTPGATLTKAQRQQLLAWAATLDQYNNGLIGPGHCSEQNTTGVVRAAAERVGKQRRKKRGKRGHRQGRK